MKVGIYGAGGAGIDFANSLSLIAPQAQIVFIDDADRTAPFPVVALSEMRSGDRFILAVRDGHVRARLEQRCSDSGLVPFELRDLTARIALGAEISAGVLCGNSLVGHSSRVGRQFQCNWYSYVGHDCRIGDYVTFAPRVSCNGNVEVGDFAYIGTGAIIREGIRIGEDAVVGMAAVVIDDVPPGIPLSATRHACSREAMPSSSSCPFSPSALRGWLRRATAHPWCRAHRRSRHDPQPRRRGVRAAADGRWSNPWPSDARSRC